MKNPRDVAGPATVKVIDVGQPPHRTFTGTAFAINDRMVVSCAHVVNQPGSQLVLAGPSYLGDIAVEWIVHEDLDVALGTTKTASLPSWLPLACVGIETAVTCFGYHSLSDGLRQWQDNVSGTDHINGLVVLQNGLHRGCSGGPVLDESLRTVGINVARHLDNATKYVLPVRTFYAWIQERGYRPQRPSGPAHGRSLKADVLLEVPLGPIIGLHEIPFEVTFTFANTLNTFGQAKILIGDANRLILECNLERLETMQITLLAADMPTFDSPNTFWTNVFSLLGARSRRSVAALLEARYAPNPQDEPTRQVFERFKAQLRNPNTSLLDHHQQH